MMSLTAYFLLIIFFISYFSLSFEERRWSFQDERLDQTDSVRAVLAFHGERLAFPASLSRTSIFKLPSCREASVASPHSTFACFKPPSCLSPAGCPALHARLWWPRSGFILDKLAGNANAPLWNVRPSAGRFATKQLPGMVSRAIDFYGVAAFALPVQGAVN